MCRAGGRARTRANVDAIPTYTRQLTTSTTYRPYLGIVQESKIDLFSQ